MFSMQRNNIMYTAYYTRLIAYTLYIHSAVHTAHCTLYNVRHTLCDGGRSTLPLPKTYFVANSKKQIIVIVPSLSYAGRVSLFRYNYNDVFENENSYFNLLCFPFFSLFSCSSKLNLPIKPQSYLPIASYAPSQNECSFTN